MFKSNLSPFNPAKDKFSNANFMPNNNDMHMNQNNNQPNYQYSKSNYAVTGNINQKYEINNQKYQIGSGLNNHPPLSPLSPNIIKGPMSPTSKIKMHSNALTLNKKILSNNNPTALMQNTHDNSLKQNKIFSKLGNKHQKFDLTDSVDLKCDQVLEDSDISQRYKQQKTLINKETPIQKQTFYHKKTKLNMPILNLQADLDQNDLKCDEVLDLGCTEPRQESKRNIKFVQNGYSDLQNNFTYINQMTRNTNNRLEYNQKPLSQGPLTPNYQKKRINPAIMVKKQIERCQTQANNSSNPYNNGIQQKCKSYSNILTPNNNSNKIQRQLNNQEDHYKIQQEDHLELELQGKQKSSSEQTDRNEQQLRKYIQRTASILNAYRKKLQEAEQRNGFLYSENVRLRKCLNEQGSGDRNHFKPSQTNILSRKTSLSPHTFTSTNLPQPGIGKYTYINQPK